MKRRLVLLMIMGFVAMVFAGCATSQSTQFYLLSPMDRSDCPESAPGGSVNLSLGIGPITIPKYLNRSQIVTRAGNNALSLAEFHQWAEDLDHNIAQVLGENLSLLLATDLVEIFPWNRQRPIDYQLVVDLLQFDRTPEGKATLLARWSVLDGSGQPVVQTRKFLVSAAPAGPDYGSLVTALNDTLADFSREVAMALPPLSGGGNDHAGGREELKD